MTRISNACQHSQKHRLYHAIGKSCGCLETLDTTIQLPKWVTLVVAGKRITIEQAAEIIIRTDSFIFSCNDFSWTKFLNKTFNIKLDDYGLPTQESLRGAKERWRVLPLVYLNNEQIASYYIGGPHGWCCWDGYIGDTNYEIGKWAKVSEVYNDWCEIAEAFPFLELKCQLVIPVGFSNRPKPLVQYNIRNGEVQILTPQEILGTMGVDKFNFKSRGCTKTALLEAVRFLKKKLESKL